MENNFNIDFNTEEKKPKLDETFEKERKEIADKNGILNYEELTKKEDGKWYIHGMEVDAYNEAMSGRDSDDLYKH